MTREPERAPCLGVAVWAVGGIVASELARCSLVAMSIAAVCFGAAVLMGRGKRRMAVFGLCVFTVFFALHEMEWRRAPGRVLERLRAGGVERVEAEGVVTSDAVEMRGGKSRFEMRVERLSRAKVDFPAEVIWTGSAPAWGDGVRVKGGIDALRGARNPGEYDPVGYLERRGIFGEIVCEGESAVTGHGKGNRVLGWAREARGVLERRITEGIRDDAEVAGLVETVTLGARGEVPEADRELFQHVGALHLFVVNGLHVGLLAVMLGLLLKPAGIRRRAFAAVMIPALFGYALVTGMSPGSVRAAIMAAVLLGGSFAERRSLSMNALGAAALALLLWDTNELCRTGFQFSFGVVAAILLLAGRVRRVIEPAGMPDPFVPRSLWSWRERTQEAGWKRVSELAAVSVAATAGAAPFNAGYFHLMTPWAFAANLLLVPMAFGMLSEGVFSLGSALSGGLATAFNNMNWLLGRGMLWVVHGFGWLPGAYWYVSTAWEHAPECRVTVLDLEPGEAEVIESGGKCWLVDCGNEWSYARVVKPYLEWRGVSRLDGLVVTHGAAAEMGAAREVLADYRPAAVMEAALGDKAAARRALDAAMSVAAAGKEIVEAGDGWQIGKAVCTVLYPPAGLTEVRRAAEKSLVLRVEAGGARVLLEGESGFAGAAWLRENVKDLRAAVVAMGGGSGPEENDAGLALDAKAQAAVRGEPGYHAGAGTDEEWARRMRQGGVEPFLQSETGAVTMEMDGGKVRVRGFLSAD